MQPLVTQAKSALETLRTTPQNGHIQTGDIRRLSARLYRSLADKSCGAVLEACGKLLAERDWALGVIAFDFAYRVRKQYDESTFAIFESWLERYVRGWGDCDDFCTHAFGALLCQFPSLVDKAFAWAAREEFWMRRAAAVVLIPTLWHDTYKVESILRVADALLLDEHDLVRKGYGWMLKILYTKEPHAAFDYLQLHSADMPRVAFRYALEKMDADKRKLLMLK